MTRELKDIYFGCVGSPFLLGERIATTESRIPEKQIFFDLPRTEPRHAEEAADQAPPDLKDPEAIRDGMAAPADTRKMDGVVFARPFMDGRSQSFTAAAEGQTLTVLTETGRLDFCFEDPETLRICGKGTGLRFYAPLMDHEAAIDRQDGTYQVCIEAACEFLFVPLKGSAEMDNPWELMHGGTRKLLLTVSPDSNGEFEMAIHMASSSCERREVYRPFEKCSSGLIREIPRISADKWIQNSLEALTANADEPEDPERTAEEAAVLSDPLLPRKENGEYLLGSEERFDLRSVPFSRRGSFICVLENDTDRHLYLSVTRSPEMWAQRLHLIRTVPVLGSTELPYAYDVEPGKLTVRTSRGQIGYCFDRDGRLHIQGQGSGLQLKADLLPGETVIQRENGILEATFDTVGSFLFVPVNGKLVFRLIKDGFTLNCIPAKDTSFDLLIENGVESPDLLPVYTSFDECVRDAEIDFDDYAKRFPVLPDKLYAKARLAAWVIWSHTLGPAGLLKAPVVYMTRSQWVRAFSWQQSFQAMAACGDLREAWKLLLNVFDYADRCGQLPDSIGDIGGTWRVTKPALQGLAMLWLTERYGSDKLTEEDFSQLYTRLTRTTRWWLTFRDRNGSGLPQYFHADESPGEFCSVFREGVPLYAPDIASFVALSAEACGKLAGQLGKKNEEQEWLAISKEIIRKMIALLWDGDRFQSRLVCTGKTVESRCILAFLPVMLGNRLPREIMDKLLSHLTDESAYLTKVGLAVEHLADADADSIPMGTTVYLNTLFAVSLMYAGEVAFAKEIAKRALGLLTEKGFCFLDLREDPTSKKAVESHDLRIKKPAPAAKWCSWLCACFFILGDIVKD